MKYLTSLLCLFIACYDVFSAGWSSAWPSYNVDTRKLVTVSHIPAGINNPVFAKDAWSADCYNAIMERLLSINANYDGYLLTNSYLYPRFYRSERDNFIKFKTITQYMIPNFVNQYYDNKSKIESWYGYTFPGFVHWTKTGILARANVPKDFFEHTTTFRSLGEDTNYGWHALYRILNEITTKDQYDSWYTQGVVYSMPAQYNYAQIEDCYENCLAGADALPELWGFFPAVFEEIEGEPFSTIYAPRNGIEEVWSYNYCIAPPDENPCDDLMMFSCRYSTWASIGYPAFYASTNIVKFYNSPVMKLWYKQTYVYSSNCFRGNLPSSWPQVEDSYYNYKGEVAASAGNTFIWRDVPLTPFYFDGWVFDRWSQAIEPYLNRYGSDPYPENYLGFFSWGNKNFDCGTYDNCSGTYVQEAESVGPSTAILIEWNYEYK